MRTEKLWVYLIKGNKRRFFKPSKASLMHTKRGHRWPTGCGRGAHLIMEAGVYWAPDPSVQLPFTRDHFLLSISRTSLPHLSSLLPPMFPSSCVIRLWIAHVSLQVPKAETCQSPLTPHYHACSKQGCSFHLQNLSAVSAASYLLLPSSRPPPSSAGHRESFQAGLYGSVHSAATVTLLKFESDLITVPWNH